MKRETNHRRSAPRERRRSRAKQVQHRRFVLVVCLLALMVVVTAASSHSCREEAGTVTKHLDPTTTSTVPTLVSAFYNANLMPAESGPASTPVAVLALDFDAVAGTLAFRLEVATPLADPSIAALCQGSPGERGATIFTLFPGPSVAGDFTGVLAEGTVNPLDLVGPLKGASLEDLVRLVQTGGVYASIGTRQYPIDAVRGQIE